MDKPIIDLISGDVITALVWPDGRRREIRGGPFEVASIAPTGGAVEDVPQIEIVGASCTRAARYANGATHAEVQ